MTTRSVSVFIWFWLFVIPLSFNFWGLDPALYSKFLLLDLSLILAGGLILTKGPGEVSIARPVLIFALFYALYIPLSLISLLMYRINPSDGEFVWIHLFTLPVFVMLLSAIDRQARIQRYEVSFVISCLVGCSIVIGLVQYALEINAHGWYLAASDVMKATYAHKNIFAEVLLLTLPFSIYAGLGGGRTRIAPALVAIATVLTILLLLSRAVWLGLAVATFVIAATYYLASHRMTPKWYHLVAVLGVLACAYYLYHWFIWRTNAGDYLAYFYQHRDTVNERRHLWTATWRVIRLHPLFGSGTGSWKVLNMRYGIIGLRDYATFFQQPHCDYLWVVSEQGIFAFLAAGAAWAWAVYRLIKRIYEKPSDAFLYCLLFALAGYGVYAAMAFPRERAEHGIILAFVLFFILSGEDQVRIPFRIKRWWPVLIVLSAGLWWSGEKMISEIHLRRYFEARSRNDIADQRLELSGISEAYYRLDGTATPIAWYRGMLNFSEGKTDDALRDFEEAVQANPYHIYSLCNVGACLNLKGDKAGAEKYFRLALDYSPGFPDAALNMCAIRYAEGKPNSAAMYLGMMNEPLDNGRYVRSLNVITQAIAGPILDSIIIYDNDAVRQKLIYLLKTSEWQADIFKKAYIHGRSSKEQVLKDILWSIKYQDHDTASADKFEKLLKQNRL